MGFTVGAACRKSADVGTLNPNCLNARHLFLNNKGFNMPKVSVIVPCYNVGPYVERCLNSLTGQSLRDIEIICIDDKSTDDTLSVVEKCAAADERIHIIRHTENTGVSTARNDGLARATGEYVGFVDPDDYVDLDFYEKLYNTAVAEDADIARGGVRITDTDGNARIERSIIDNIKKFGKWRFFWQWWTAIYRHDMLTSHNITFPANIPTGQDSVFLTDCIRRANKVAICESTNYNYVHRDFSLDESILSPTKIESRINMTRMILAMYNESDMPADDYVVCYHERWNSLRYQMRRNTSYEIKRQMLQNLVEMFKQCRNQRGFLDLLVKTDAHNAGYLDMLRSHDVDGMLEYMTRRQPVTAPVTNRNTNRKYLLFNCIPVLEFKRRGQYDTLRLFGIQLYKIKRQNPGFVLYILYIPIIKEKH